MKAKSSNDSHQPLSLRRNFSWTFLGQIVYAGCQWGMLVVLAKLGTPEMVGIFTLGLAVTAPIILFSNLQLRTIQATDAKQSYRFSDYLWLRLITVFFALLVIVWVAYVSGYRGETAIVILLIGLAKAIESVSDVYYGLLQQYERMDRIAKSMIVKGLLSLIGLAIGVYLTRSVVWGTASLVVAWGLILFAYDIHSGIFVGITTLGMYQRRTQKPPDKTFVSIEIAALVKLAGIGLPLGFVMMLISLNSNIPRYFIERLLGQRELGIFSAIAYLQVAGITIVSALGQSASPRLAKYYAAKDRLGFGGLILKLLGIGLGLGIVSILVALVAGRQILTVLYQAEYAEHTDILIWIMVATAIGYIGSFLGYSMSAAQYYRIQLPLFIVVTGATALSSFYLIAPYKLLGAALVFVIGAVVQLVGSLVVTIHAVSKLNTLRDRA